MKRRRILSGGIAQESHSFNPILSKRDRFVISYGDDAVAKARGANSVLGGVVSGALDTGVEVVVPASFQAQSGGPVEDKVLDEVLDIFVKAARKGDFDAIVLTLHGGMLTPTLDDPEAVLMNELRSIVGADVPITAGYDLHAYVTPQSLASCDFLAAYLTNPHADQAATGRRAFDAAIGMLDGRLDPVCASVFFPMLTLGNDRTDESPLRELHLAAKSAIQAGRAYDVSIFNAQQFLDVPNVGQAILVYGNGEEREAAVLARELADRLWSERDHLVGAYTSVDTCFDRIEHGATRLILGDQGDRVAAGSPGDSTFILKKLMDRDLDVAAVIPICDPIAVDKCFGAGESASIEIEFGGKFCKAAPPVVAEGTVERLGENVAVRYDGPAQKGMQAVITRCAVFRIGKIRVLLTSEPYSYLDPDYFRAAGIDLDEQRIVVTRSGYHYTLNFAPVGECITVDTPGPSSYDVAQFSWQRARPFYPLDKIGFQPTAHVRRRSGATT